VEDITEVLVCLRSSLELDVLLISPAPVTIARRPALREAKGNLLCPANDDRASALRYP